MNVRRERVLILCTHNSSRSQMAEGFLRALAGDRFDVKSAGTEATRVHPFAIRAMDEIAIDIRLQSRLAFSATSQLAVWIEYAKEAEEMAAE